MCRAARNLNNPTRNEVPCGVADAARRLRAARYYLIL